MNLRSPLSDLKIRATTVAAVLMAMLVGAVALGRLVKEHWR